VELEMREVKEGIKVREAQLSDLEAQLSLLQEYTELQRLGAGKSFGEKALITNSLRAANVYCTLDCHFAIVSKHDYDRVLRKIEVKIQNKMIDFL